MPDPIELNDNDFFETIKEGITLVDFWAPWCAPCVRQEPIIGAVADKIGDKATIAKLNVDEASKAAKKYGIRAIPTVIIFKDGEIAKQITGLAKEKDLIEIIDNNC